MPMETNMPVGIRPIERPSTPSSTEGVSRRGDGGSSSAFSPRTNVAIQTAVDDMAGILSKIASGQDETMEKMPEDLQKVVQNVLKQAFSMNETLSQGIGSTLESQRFSMEQLTAISRMLNQLSNLVEKGYSLDFGDDLQALLKNFKNFMTSQEGNALEPVLLNKAAFQLLDNKTLQELPEALQQILAQMQSMGAASQMSSSGQEDSSMGFLKQLVQYFMPRQEGKEGESAGYMSRQPSGQGEAKNASQQPGMQQSGNAQQGQQAAGNQTSQGTTGQTQQGTGQLQQESAEPQQGNTAQNQQGSSMGQQQAPGGTQPAGTQGQGASQQAMPQEGASSQNAGGNPQGGPQAQGNAQQSQGPSQANVPSQGNQGGNAAQSNGAVPQGNQGGGTEGNAASSSAGRGALSEGAVSQELSGQPSTGRQQAGQEGRFQEGFPNRYGQESQREAVRPTLAQQARIQLVRVPMQNTPQVMETMKGMAQLLLKDAPLTEQDTALLQNFVNGRGQVMSEKEAKQLQTLLRLCQQNVPTTVQQAAVQQNLPDLPRLWAFMQLCDMAVAKRMNARQLKKAGKDVADMVLSMRHSMTGSNSSVPGQRSLNFRLPPFLGDNEKSYPAYIHVYDENAQDPYTGEFKKETWLRLCVLTDNIGAVELTCRVFDNQQLDMRLFFSSSETANEFRECIPEFRKSMRGMGELTLNEVKVGAVGERRFM